MWLPYLYSIIYTPFLNIISFLYSEINLSVFKTEVLTFWGTNKNDYKNVQIFIPENISFSRIYYFDLNRWEEEPIFAFSSITIDSKLYYGVDLVFLPHKGIFLDTSPFLEIKNSRKDTSYGDEDISKNRNLGMININDISCIPTDYPYETPQGIIQVKKSCCFKKI